MSSPEWSNLTDQQHKLYDDIHDLFFEHADNVVIVQEMENLQALEEYPTILSLEGTVVNDYGEKSLVRVESMMDEGFTETIIFLRAREFFLTKNGVVCSDDPDILFGEDNIFRIREMLKITNWSEQPSDNEPSNKNDKTV